MYDGNCTWFGRGHPLTSSSRQHQYLGAFSITDCISSSLLLLAGKLRSDEPRSMPPRVSLAPSKSTLAPSKSTLSFVNAAPHNVPHSNSMTGSLR
eukprot:CAMPEP_0197618720 /NCGR_PEP_ID=MMETSP1326-20131121/61675_1 /TAXON_ID=1155430 /ORGANISM="Genus nov. species nov., Strain RCC2288" /LENGTH=94 /DNA_ID=CAMNT_0043187621 /DNA_START=1988 /DNA_END=2272 /DNA_ORIENTATION=+